MKKIYYLSLLTSLSLFTACDRTSKTEKTTASSTTEAPKPPVYEFGFNLNDYNIVKDTLKQGDTFGKLLEEQHIGATEIHHITEVTKEFIKPKDFRVGHPYAFLFDKKHPIASSINPIL